MSAAVRLRQLLNQVSRKPPPGVSPAAQRLAELQAYDLGGVPVVAQPGPEFVEAIQSATPVLRRKVMSDLTGPDKRLKSVIETGRTGAASGGKRSAEARSVKEPLIFGDPIGGAHPAYGALFNDPRKWDSLVTQLYPDSGVIIKPDHSLHQYGRYGLVPRDKFDRATYTLADSLDNLGVPYKFTPSAIDLLSGPEFNPNSISPRSALAQLASEYGERPGPVVPYDAWLYHDNAAYAIRDKRDKFLDDFPAALDLPNEASLLRGFPRPLSDPLNVPLGPYEVGLIPDAMAALRQLPKSYAYNAPEYQLHGPVTPDRIERVIDYGIEPSSPLEKKLRALGIDYEPVVPPDSLLRTLNELKKRGGKTSEFLQAAELRPSQEPGGADNYLLHALRDQIKLHGDGPFPYKVSDHYSSGGAVT